MIDERVDRALAVISCLLLVVALTPSTAIAAQDPDPPDPPCDEAVIEEAIELLENDVPPLPKPSGVTVRFGPLPGRRVGLADEANGTITIDPNKLAVMVPETGSGELEGTPCDSVGIVASILNHEYHHLPPYNIPDTPCGHLEIGFLYGFRMCNMIIRMILEEPPKDVGDLCIIYNDWRLRYNQFGPDVPNCSFPFEALEPCEGCP